MNRNNCLRGQIRQNRTKGVAVDLAFMRAVKKKKIYGLKANVCRMEFLLGFLHKLETRVAGKFTLRSQDGRRIYLIAKKLGIFGKGSKKIKGAHTMEKAKLHHQPWLHQLQHAEKEKSLITLHRSKNFFTVKG